MFRATLTLSAVLLLVLSGVVHGLWTQRWGGFTAAEAAAAAGRLHDVPLRVGAWDGHVVQISATTMPEEVVGHNVSIRYVHRVTGDVVLVYLACGPKAALAGHSPLQCYPAAGYKTSVPQTRVWPLPEPGPGGPDLSAATFSLGQPPAVTHVRVFWCWRSLTGRWQAPDNPWRTFRAEPLLYKCYVMRQPVSPEEPLSGDACMALFKDLAPELDRALTAAPDDKTTAFRRERH
jgi:hypothetical protein